MVYIGAESCKKDEMAHQKYTNAWPNNITPDDVEHSFEIKLFIKLSYMQFSCM